MPSEYQNRLAHRPFYGRQNAMRGTLVNQKRLNVDPATHKRHFTSGLHRRHRGSMLSWILRTLVAISIADAADIVRVPLVPRQRINEQGAFSGTLAKRKIGYSPLVDHVVYQGNYVDIAYLGLVSIGTPPQSFLLGISLRNEN